jgi:hypothetical protein
VIATEKMLNAGISPRDRARAAKRVKRRPPSGRR